MNHVCAIVREAIRVGVLTPKQQLAIALRLDSTAVSGADLVALNELTIAINNRSVTVAAAGQLAPVRKA